MTPEERQSALLDAYLDALNRDLNAPPPPDLDPQAAAQARMLVATLSTDKLSQAQTARVWQQARAKLPQNPRANNHAPHKSISVRSLQDQQMTSLTPSKQTGRSRAIGIFSWGIAAAITLVTLGVIWLMSNVPPQPELGAPSLVGEESPSPFPTPTMIVATATVNFPTPTPTVEPPTPTMSLINAFNWPNSRALNVLILGVDQRGEEAGPFRTDTIMVANIDPISKAINLLSIPRDLWVVIPGYEPGRINTANFIGDNSGYPGGGPALAAAAIEANLGIPIDRYIRLNFDVFTSLVSALAPDGVEVCPETAIDDPNYPDGEYGYSSVHFDAGCQMLDAERLLQYARTRITAGGDFDRAARQQEVLRSLYDTLASEEGTTWLRIVQQMPSLWEQLLDAFDTDFTLDELIGLAALVQQIPGESIYNAVLDQNYVQPTVTEQGMSVLVLEPDRFAELREHLFGRDWPPAVMQAATFTPEIPQPLVDALNQLLTATPVIDFPSPGEIPASASQVIVYALAGDTIRADAGNQERQPFSSVDLNSGEVVFLENEEPTDGWLHIYRPNRASRWIPANQVEIVPFDASSTAELRGLCVIRGIEGDGYDLRTAADHASQFVGHVNYPNRMQVLGHQLGRDGAIWYLIEGDSGGIRIRGWAPADSFLAEDDSCPPGASQFGAIQGG